MAERNEINPGIGIRLIRRLVEGEERVFTARRAAELAPELGISRRYVPAALHRLVRAGWLERLRRGLYAVTIDGKGAAAVHEFEIAMALVEPAAISHWSAMQFHGLTDQIPRTVYVLTTTDASVPRERSSREPAAPSGYRVGHATYRFVQVRPERFFGIEDEWVGEARIRVTDPERTLLDGLARPRYCGDFAEVLHAFEVRRPHLDVQRIVDYAVRFDAATARRLGWVLERLGVGGEPVARLQAVAVRGYRKLDPSGPNRGPFDRRWMVRENLPGRTAE